jgi:hypothetical protein
MDASKPTPHRFFLPDVDHRRHAERIQAEIIETLGVPKEVLGFVPRGTPTIRAARQAFEDLREFTELTNRAFREMGKILCQFALAIETGPSKEMVYLLHHNRLPGSNRTSRLRKKRRTRVEKWYQELKRRKS